MSKLQKQLAGIEELDNNTAMMALECGLDQLEEMSPTQTND